MSLTIPLDAIYTTDEAAARLRVSRRTMIKLGRDLGSCSMMGREYFSASAISSIFGRLSEQCRRALKDARST